MRGALWLKHICAQSARIPGAPVFRFWFIYLLKSMVCHDFKRLARRLLILKTKAPFSSPVAGSGKPFLPSLTLPANRDFLFKNTRPTIVGRVFLNLNKLIIWLKHYSDFPIVNQILSITVFVCVLPKPEYVFLLYLDKMDSGFSDTKFAGKFFSSDKLRVLDIGPPFP